MNNYNKINGFNVIKRINLGASAVEKYIIEKNRKKYLLRLYDIRFMSSRYEAFKNIAFLENNGILVPKIYEFGELGDGIHGYAIVEWLEGIPLDKLLIDNDSASEYGRKAGFELLKMHNLKAEEKVNVYEKYISSVNKKMEKIKRLGLKYDFNKIEEFILGNCGILQDRNSSIIHGDFHPGNLIVKEDKVYFIDLDVCKNDFAWVDLSTNSCNMDYPSFYAAVINEYFGNKIPEDFWLIYNLYGILYCLDYLLYCKRMNGKTVEDGIQVLKKFVFYNDNFRVNEPLWFDKNIETKRRIIK